MSTASFNGLLIASAIAVAAPILATSVRRVKLPSAVVEIVAGTVVGPSVLGWGNIDQLVDAIALLGLTPLRTPLAPISSDVCVQIRGNPTQSIARALVVIPTNSRRNQWF